MKNQKLLFFVLALIIGILLVVLGVSNNGENESETATLTSGDETKILLYFADKEKTKLVQEYRNVSLKDVQENVFETIAKELLKGPVSPEFVSVIPFNTKVNTVTEEGNKIIIDFSEEFQEESGDQNVELLKIYSIVNSFTELKEIEEVEIRVNGNMIAKEKRI